MRASDQVGRSTSVYGFIERGFLESNAVSIKLAGPELARSEGRDRRRIYTAAKEGTDRYVRNQPALDRSGEKSAQLFAPTFLRVGRHLLKWLDHEIPVRPNP